MYSEIIVAKIKKDNTARPNVYINGAGVLHVRSSEILKSTEGRRQLAALGRLKKKQIAAA